MNKVDFLMALANNIRAERLSKGFTQDSFAKHIGIARRYYGDIETGKINPSIVNLMKIVRGLETTLSDLLPKTFFL